MTLEGEVSIVHAFALPSIEDGDGPSSNLTLATDGHLYGTTAHGGAHGGSFAGTVFRLTLTGVKTTLHSFGPTDTAPGNPVGGVTQGNDGAFYGATMYDGIFRTGSIYKLVPR